MAAKKARKRKSAKSPLERPAPRRSRHTKLTTADKTPAKRRTKKSGRTSANLADNPTVARKKREPRRTPTKEPQGLVATGRMLLWPRDRSGAESGKPARLGLAARAWGELVPRTIAAARRIAAKGRQLLERYRLQSA